MSGWKPLVQRSEAIQQADHLDCGALILGCRDFGSIRFRKLEHVQRLPVCGLVNVRADGRGQGPEHAHARGYREVLPAIDAVGDGIAVRRRAKPRYARLV